MSDSRQFVPELLATLDPSEGGRARLLAPQPGLWRDGPPPGSLVRAGDSLGALEILGVLHRLVAPEDTHGVVVADARGPARRAVDFGAPLLTLDREALGAAAVDAAGPGASEASSTGEMVFRSPSSGRFYVRPAPDRPAFIEVGQIIERGQTIGVLEVMKTFTRINYDDAKLPAKAKITAIVAADQGDLSRGDPILRLEPVA